MWTWIFVSQSCNPTSSILLFIFSSNLYLHRGLLEPFPANIGHRLGTQPGKVSRTLQDTHQKTRKPIQTPHMDMSMLDQVSLETLNCPCVTGIWSQVHLAAHNEQLSIIRPPCESVYLFTEETYDWTWSRQQLLCPQTTNMNVNEFFGFPEGTSCCLHRHPKLMCGCEVCN